MSHIATAWLSQIEPDRMTAGEFRVMFHLCDCHNPRNGCFPSQEFLREKTGLSNGGLNKILSGLEDKGLLRRNQRYDEDKKRRLSTLYMLGFEADLTPHSGDSKEADLTPLSASTYLHHSGDKPVKGTCNLFIGETGATFDDFWSSWPLAKIAKKNAEKAFAKLSPMERSEATSKAAAWAYDWRQRCPNANDIHPATYLNAKRWTDETTAQLNLNGGPREQFAYERKLSRADATTLAIAVAGRTRRAPDPDFL